MSPSEQARDGGANEGNQSQFGQFLSVATVRNLASNYQSGIAALYQYIALPSNTDQIKDR